MFRIGGDEFAAILYDVSDAQWQQLKSEFYEKLKKHNAGNANRLSVAMGCASMRDGVKECMRRADRRMYRDKANIKAGQEPSGIDRD